MVQLLIDLLCAVAALVLGVAISAVNYRISKRVLLKRPEIYASATILRQICNVLYLVVIYFVSRWLTVSMPMLLVAAALGVTISSFYFTAKLLKLNSSLPADRAAQQVEQPENTPEGEEAQNG